MLFFPTYRARHHALSRHQVVVETLQATVQGVGDPALVVVQRGVHGLLGSQRAARRLLIEKGGGVEVGIRTAVIIFNSISVLLRSSK